MCGVEYIAILFRLIPETSTFWCILIPKVGTIFGLASNKSLKPVPKYTTENKVAGINSLLPPEGLKLVTFWMLQDRCVKPHSATQDIRGLTAKQNHTQYNVIQLQTDMGAIQREQSRIICSPVVVSYCLRFSALIHLSFKYLMCWLTKSFFLKIKHRNLSSLTTDNMAPCGTPIS